MKNNYKPAKPVKKLIEALKQKRDPKEVSNLLNLYLDVLLVRIAESIAGSENCDLGDIKASGVKFSEYAVMRLVLVKYWNSLESREVISGRCEQMDRYIGACEAASFEKEHNHSSRQ